jgi:hypothetical protein
MMMWARGHEIPHFQPRSTSLNVVDAAVQERPLKVTKWVSKLMRVTWADIQPRAQEEAVEAAAALIL